MKENADTITDLLLGAAYADKRLEGDELAEIEKLLCKLLDTDALPEGTAARIKSFNPARFDVHEAAGSLSQLSDDDKKKVLELVVSVNESDDVLDFDEDEYLRKVAKGLGLEDEVVQSMTLEVLEDEELEGLLVDDA